MTTTAAPASMQGILLMGAQLDGGAATVSVEPDVLGQDAAGTLTVLVAEQAREDAAAAQKMRAVTHWADLHRVAEDEFLLRGAMDRELAEALEQRPAKGLEGVLRLAGEGAFMVSEFAVCDLAAALGMSEPAARAYVGQSVELRERLPRLWARVMDGALAAWRARLVAKETIPLNAAAAAYVDAQLAGFAHRISPGRVLKAVQAAVLRHDPELAARQAANAAERRGVWLEDRLDGTTEICAVTGTPDATAFDAALNSLATILAGLGDTDRRDVRRAKAVGVLADPQYALDLTTSGATPDAAAPAKAPGKAPTMHLHLHESAVKGLPAGGVVRVAGHGPRAVGAVERWLADLAPGAVVKVTPVVDLTERISVDAYEIPERLRAQVEERDPGCVFPWCGRTGRHDIDHIDPFIPPDEGGPPGQSSTDNLARLCRFHHRVKTHSDWDYRRRPDGSLTWTSPLGRRYRVDHTGTANLA